VNDARGSLISNLQVACVVLPVWCALGRWDKPLETDLRIAPVFAPSSRYKEAGTIRYFWDAGAISSGRFGLSRTLCSGAAVVAPLSLSINSLRDQSVAAQTGSSCDPRHVVGGWQGGVAGLARQGGCAGRGRTCRGGGGGGYLRRLTIAV